MISNSDIEKILDRADIVDVVGQFVQLQRSGIRYKACCPFHQEDTPSFMVDQARGLWYCFGACKEGGNVIKFVEKINNMNFPEACKSRKTKCDGREKRKAIFEAKTKCAQKSRLLPPSGQNTSVVQTPFESCLNDAFLLNFLLKYHLKTHCQFSKKSYLYIVVMLPLCIPSYPHP